ncbi:AbrB/MazE/SpoVT family DNA-binding domain-containing protein [Robertmurraya korlensis]|uniref:AbrB/MazE/SpoVT family DNA-binding domain-containing protein n=1 Tax=Robertmurraya korlensis TaxID=519977 RepID=UPI0020418FF6|nr:AbrB/MazE/SpoVT family DNA-binding domain-containing protein [Robertmurraya korlensis]MCM3603156.1 AbrB/MazE/SpoVT family DNA-binding domain-containing protein [Robertmurraya korlensis]
MAKVNILNGFGDLENIRESRDIKITSKRQLTIPKAYFDYLGIEETVHAILLDDGILIKPEKKQSLQEIDVEVILRNVMNEGYTGDELADEFSRRVKEYNKVLDRRIEEFLNDMTSDTVSEANEGDDFNGLDIFFNTEDGENSEAIREKK